MVKKEMGHTLRGVQILCKKGTRTLIIITESDIPKKSVFNLTYIFGNCEKIIFLNSHEAGSVTTTWHASRLRVQGKASDMEFNYE